MKHKLSHGSKGVYLNGIIIMHDKPDQFGNDGMIVQDITEEERKAGKKGAILGNIKILTIETDPDDIPF
jgi:hypothetical protein